MSIKKLLRPGALVPAAISFLLLLFVGVFALTREDDGDVFVFSRDDPDFAFLEDDYGFPEPDGAPVWVPPAPPRWFRSNAGGMALEEIPSRLAALRNRHALVMDFISPDELEPILRPFFDDGFDIEIRVLFEYGEESRRQWLFVDSAGVVRLNAVFRRPTEGMEGDFYAVGFMEAEDEHGAFPWEQPEPFAEEPAAVHADAEPPPPSTYPEDFAEGLAYGIAYGPDYYDGYAPEAEAVAEAPPPPRYGYRGAAPVGFIEVFNEDGRIARDYLFAEDGTETVIVFFYGGELLIRAETKRRHLDDSPWKFQNVHTDHFRYNRSFALRYVERVFHYPADAQPVRLTFPFRALDAAMHDDFIRRRVSPGSDFLDTYDFDAGDGFNVRYETDPRGRVLTQTMFDEHGEIVWQIQNVWYGDRIVAITRIEDGLERLTEFEFDGEGNRVLQREIRDGVLERLVRTEGYVETEELYMDGVLVMVARWEDGRRVSEERVRRR